MCNYEFKMDLKCKQKHIFQVIRQSCRLPKYRVRRKTQIRIRKLNELPYSLKRLHKFIAIFYNVCGRIFTFHAGMWQDITSVVFAKCSLSAND